MRGGKRSGDRRIGGDRAATLVEYALLVALVAMVAIGAIELLGDRAADHYERTRSDLTDGGGGSGDGGGGGSGGGDGGWGGGGDVDGGPGGDGEPAAPPSISTSCSGATCGLNLTNVPEGATVTWSVNPTAATSEGPPFSITAAKNEGPYTVTATLAPSGEEVTVTVTCSKGNDPVCTTTS